MNLRTIKRQPTTYLRSQAAADAVTSLRYAMAAAKQAGAKRTAAKIRLALKSAEGAHRHAIRMHFASADASRAATAPAAIVIDAPPCAHAGRLCASHARGAAATTECAGAR